MFVQTHNDSLLKLVKIQFSIDSSGNGDLRNYLEELRQKIIVVQPVIGD